MDLLTIVLMDIRKSLRIINIHDENDTLRERLDTNISEKMEVIVSSLRAIHDKRANK